MLYDRPYMREDSVDHQVRYLAWIVGSCIAIYALQHFIAASIGSKFSVDAFSADWFSLSKDNLASGKIWTLFTYAFLHGNAMHIILNLLVIFIIGRMLERTIGSKNLLILFIASILIGGTAWTALHFNLRGSLVGASAGAAGMVVLFCLLEPQEKIQLLLFFVIPVTIKRIWIVWAMLAMDGILFLLSELPLILNKAAAIQNSNIGHSAHLGGMLAGFIYFKLLHNTPKQSSQSVWQGIEIEPPKWMSKSNKAMNKTNKFTLNMTDKKEVKAEVDRILDKINENGFGALSEEEKEILDQAKEYMKR